MNDREKLIDKVAKLMAKGKDAGVTEAEAQAFLAKAYQLMAENSVKEWELGLKEGKKTEYAAKVIYVHKRGSMTLRKKMIAALLIEFFNVKVLFVTAYPSKDIKVEVFGTPKNVDTAAYMHEYLLRTYQNLFNDFRRRNRGMNVSVARVRNSFYAGVNAGFRAAMRKAKREQEEKAGIGTALVVIGKELDDAHKNYLADRKVRQTKNRNQTGDPEAYADGYSKGREIQVGNNPDQRRIN